MRWPWAWNSAGPSSLPASSPAWPPRAGLRARLVQRDVLEPRQPVAFADNLGSRFSGAISAAAVAPGKSSGLGGGGFGGGGGARRRRGRGRRRRRLVGFKRRSLCFLLQFAATPAVEAQKRNIVLFIDARERGGDTRRFTQVVLPQVENHERQLRRLGRSGALRAPRRHPSPEPAWSWHSPGAVSHGRRDRSAGPGTGTRENSPDLARAQPFFVAFLRRSPAALVFSATLNLTILAINSAGSGWSIGN